MASSPVWIGAAAGNPNIAQQLLQGVKLGDQTYKNHLDGPGRLRKQNARIKIV
jgi:hypothetical protein